MLTRSGPVLIDFGTALGYTANQTLVVTSQVLTPAYAPLEQYASAARLGPPTDLYALGATLYHAVTGRVPVSSMDRASGIALSGVRTLAPQLSAPLAGVIERCLALQVADRPQTAEAVRAALGGISSLPPMTVPGQASPVNQVGSPPLAPTVFVQPAGSSPAPAPVVATPSAHGSPAPSSVPVARRRQPASPWWLLAGLLVLGGGAAAWWLTRPPSLTGAPVNPISARNGPASSVTAQRVEVRATELNVRKGPGTNHPVIRIGTANLRVSRGAELEVEESQNGWYRVKVNGTDGWISGRLTLPLSPTVDDAELNRAIQAIEAGGRVDLRAGVYLVPRTLTPGPSLALIGMDMDETYLISAGDEPVLRYRGPGSFAARDLTFGYRGSAWTSVVTLEDAEFDLERTRFIGAWDGDDPEGPEGDGLAVLGRSVGQVRSSEFLTNRWRGLSVSDASAVTITDSAFQFNDGSGLVLNDQAQASLERSRATGNRLQGFKALGQAQLILMSSAALDNRGGGVAFDEAASGRLERTECSSNEGFALRVQTSARVESDSSPSCRITPKAQAAVTPQVITLAEATTVADEYLTFGAMDDLSRVGEVYADQIRYYDRGLVSRPAVLADKLAYYGRWPQRQYARVSAVRSLPTGGGGRRVEFEYEFRVSDPFGDEAAGKARVVLSLERQGGRVRIVEENGEVIERY
jgi:serine/threonine-protein kinase